MTDNCKVCGQFVPLDTDDAAALAAENATLRRAILNFWGTCRPPMNEAQQRCEDALLDALSASSET
jgi:hypothetical protein